MFLFFTKLIFLSENPKSVGWGARDSTDSRVKRHGRPRLMGFRRSLPANYY